MIYYVLDEDAHIIAEYEDRNEAYLAAEENENYYVYADFD